MGGTGVVLLGHGTKDADGVPEFLGYVDGLRQRTGLPVEPGVIEYPNERLPDIATAFARLADAGCTDVVCLPVLLFFAGHTRDDVPEAIDQAERAHPGMRVRVGGPLGIDPRLLGVVEDRLAPFGQDASTAVLLVARGSLNSEANADLHKMARMLWDRNRFGWVEAAFVSVAPPDVRTGLERCVALGAKRVLVAPYFLNTGVLVKRIAQQAQHPVVDVKTVHHLGLHEDVFAVLEQRLDEARRGLCPCRAGMGCRLPGVRCSWGTECPAAV